MNRVRYPGRARTNISDLNTVSVRLVIATAILFGFLTAVMAQVLKQGPSGVVAFALPDSGDEVLKQTTARTLRTVGILLILILASVLVLKFARKNWVWYPLLAILLVIATWSAWLASQATPLTVLLLFAAAAIAWLLSLGRNRNWWRSQA
jgi:hypothetical protein